jgi:hypothetical protein
MSHVPKLTRGRLRLAAGLAVLGLFGAVPAASQAIVAVNTAGIAGAGTVTGTWTSGPYDGQSQTLQVASVINCFGDVPPNSFDASWTDPGGASHFFKVDLFGGNSCTFPNGFGAAPQNAHLDPSEGSSSGFPSSPGDNSSVTETLTGPQWSPPNTMSFTLTTPEGTVSVSPQFPGRIQPYGGGPSAT